MKCVKLKNSRPWGRERGVVSRCEIFCMLIQFLFVLLNEFDGLLNTVSCVIPSHSLIFSGGCSLLATLI